MSFKFNPNAAEEKKYISKPGTYEVIVKSFTAQYMPPRADFYARIALANAEGEVVFSDLFSKPEKNGEYNRLNEYVAATASKEEIDGYIARGEFEIDEDWVKSVVERSIGRRLKVKVTERKYMKKDGTEGVAYQGSFFVRLPSGPEGNPF
jgi:hypothetical protein